jgi:DNA processing protein
LEIKDPPPILYLMGNKNLLNKAIAIIGSRKSTELGNRIANKVGEYFSKNWAICNGLVDGIDKNSITDNQGVFPNVIGVLSGGLNFNKTCSKITADLAERVLSNNGLLVSEFQPNQKEDQFSGSKASRIQAGLSNSLILIQSSINGGSKYTIKAFSPLQRPLAVVDFKGNMEYLTNDSFEGNRLLIEKGKQGIMEMCDLKKIEAIKVFKILKLEKSADYKTLEQEITTGNNVYRSRHSQLF